MFRVEDPNHLFFFNDEQSSGCKCGWRSHAEGLAGHTALTKKIAGPENRHNRLFSILVDHGKLDPAFPNIEDLPGGFPLRVNLA